jgi:hypothetical protein
VESGVTRWIGIDVEELGELDLKSGLLEGFTNRRVLRALADFDEPTGYRPARGWVLPPHEHDVSRRHLDQHVGRGP